MRVCFLCFLQRISCAGRNGKDIKKLKFVTFQKQDIGKIFFGEKRQKSSN